MTKRYWSVPAVLDNVDTIGVVSAGSTLQMLQVRKEIESKMRIGGKCRRLNTKSSSPTTKML